MSCNAMRGLRANLVNDAIYPLEITRIELLTEPLVHREFVDASLSQSTNGAFSVSLVIQVSRWLVVGAVRPVTDRRVNRLGHILVDHRVFLCWQNLERTVRHNQFRS